MSMIQSINRFRKEVPGATVESTRKVLRNAKSKATETILIAPIYYVKDDERIAPSEIEYRYAVRYRNDTGRKTIEEKGRILGYVRTVGEFVPTPTDTLKRTVPRHSPTFLPDPRNAKGVGNLHRSRISTRVRALPAEYCNEDGSFKNDW